MCTYACEREIKREREGEGGGRSESVKMDIGRVEDRNGEERRGEERRGRDEWIRVIKNVERVALEGGDGADVIKLKRSPASAREETISCSLSTKTVRALGPARRRSRLTVRTRKFQFTRMHRKNDGDG